MKNIDPTIVNGTDSNNSNVAVLDAPAKASKPKKKASRKARGKKTSDVNTTPTAQTTVAEADKIANITEAQMVVLEGAMKMGKTLRKKSEKENRELARRQIQLVFCLLTLGQRVGGGGDFTRRGVNKALAAGLGVKSVKKDLIDPKLVYKHVTVKSVLAGIEQALTEAKDRLNLKYEGDDLKLRTKKVEAIAAHASQWVSGNLKGWLYSIKIHEAIGAQVKFGKVSFPVARALALTVGRAYTISEGARDAGLIGNKA